MQRIFPFLKWVPLIKNTWKDDLSAGLTVTILAIPQSVAFAMIAGLPPIYGFYTAIVSSVIAALFGSSNHLVTGPTTAVSILVLAAISQFVQPAEVASFVELSIILTFLVGLIQFVLGLFSLGKVVRYVSHSVIIGFTAGAGILIGFKQLRHVFGIEISNDLNFYEAFYVIFENIRDINIYTFIIALLTLIIALILKFCFKKLSKYSMLIAMLFGSVLAILIGVEEHRIDTVGKISADLSNMLQFPKFTIDKILKLLPSAFVIACLGLVEAVAISESIAIKTQQRINKNQEFIGQGLANLMGSFFSTYVASGSFTRSALNHQTGAKTPLASIFAAIGLLIVLLFGTKFAAFLPMASMGGIILLVSYKLVDYKNIKFIVKSSKKETIVLFTTLISTLFISPVIAFVLGIALTYILKNFRLK